MYFGTPINSKLLLIAYYAIYASKEWNLLIYIVASVVGLFRENVFCSSALKMSISRFFMRADSHVTCGRSQSLAPLWCVPPSLGRPTCGSLSTWRGHGRCPAISAPSPRAAHSRASRVRPSASIYKGRTATSRHFLTDSFRVKVEHHTYDEDGSTAVWQYAGQRRRNVVSSATQGKLQLNTLKGSGVRWLHFEVFSAIQV